MSTKPDQPLEDISAIRREIAKQFRFNPKKQVAHYRPKQKQRGAKIYPPGEHARTNVCAYDVLHDRAHSEIAAGKFSTLASYRARRKRGGKRK